MKSSLMALLVVLAAGPAVAKDPAAEELLQRYDEAMGPRTFEAESQMTSWREDGSSRTYELKILKGEDDKSRVWFKAPASVKGQEILRVGDNLWVYLPNLKRATRMANRDSFQGGDFNNADILRASYSKDYTGKLVATEQPDVWALELKAKSAETAYDSIKLWLRKTDSLPVKGQYFGTSGQMLRSAEFSDFTEFEKGYTRPAKVVMHNELVKSRRSELVMKTLKRGVEAPAQRFTQADLGR